MLKNVFPVGGNSEIPNHEAIITKLIFSRKYSKANWRLIIAIAWTSVCVL